MESIGQTLDELLERNLHHVLRANHIDVGDGRLCAELLLILRKFLTKISKRFEGEIKGLLRDNPQRYKKQDLISWVVSEVAALQSITLSRFYFQICQEEGLAPGQHRVDCSRAHSHAYLLGHLYEEASREWKAGHRVEPSSQKSRKKRRSRDWMPWLIDQLFGGSED